jgi:hypothetical protein
LGRARPDVSVAAAELLGKRKILDAGTRVAARQVIACTARIVGGQQSA